MGAEKNTLLEKLLTQLLDHAKKVAKTNRCPFFIIICIIAYIGVLILGGLIINNIFKMELLPWLKYVFAVAVFLILVIAMVVLLCHKESTDTSEAYYRYQSHIADVIRDMYEAETKDCLDMLNIINQDMVRKVDIDECESIFSDKIQSLDSKIDECCKKIEIQKETNDEMAAFILSQFKRLCATGEISLNISNKKDSGAN